MSLAHTLELCPAHKDVPQHLTGLEKSRSPSCAECSKLLLYQYQPLPREGYIRLLWLFPGEDDDPLTCLLLPVSLNEAPPYEALSYVWGDPSDTVEIKCGQGRLNVTINLRDALQRLRRKHGSRRLWADAICIDQENIEERGQQVKMMGLIYWRASRVLVWLGHDSAEDRPEEDDHERASAADAFAVIRETNKACEEKATSYGSWNAIPYVTSEDIAGYDSKRWLSVSTLFSLPWFNRTWVVQEVGLAFETSFLWGGAEIRRDEFVPFINWLRVQGRVLLYYFRISTRQYGLWENYWQATRGAHRHKIGPNNSDYVSFIGILAIARTLVCSNPKDTVYAFLGHPAAFQTSPEDSTPYLDYPTNFSCGKETIIHPDYTKSVEEIYTELAVNTLKRMSNLDILSLVLHDEHSLSQQFPSWVPRWDIRKSQSPFSMDRSLYFNSSKDLAFTVPHVTENSHLELRGIFVDTVKELYHLPNSEAFIPVSHGHQGFDYEPLNIVEELWSEFSQHRWSLPNAWLHDIYGFSFTLTSGLMDNKPAEDNKDQHYADFCAYRLQKSAVSGIVRENLELAAQGGNADRFLVDLVYACEARAFFYCYNGYIGLGPKAMEEGDECWVIAGAKTPFILRPTDQPPHYRMVGEAYVHGVMRGEATEDIDEKDLEQIILY